MMADPDTTHTDRLIQQAIAGNTAAADKLIASYRAYLRKVIDLRMDDELRARFDPSDVVQETQIVAIQRIDDFLVDGPISFRVWLRRRALEQLVNMRRQHLTAAKRSVRREVMLSDHSSLAIARSLYLDAPSQRMRRQEQADKVRAAVQTLSERDREVLLLRHVEELTNMEVAEVLQMDAGAASQLYGRALRRLQNKLPSTGNSHDS